MKREFGSKLIEQVLPRLDLTHVVDTSGAYIPGHGTPTVLLFGRHRPPVSEGVRTVMGIKGEPNAPEVPAQGLVWRAIVDQIDMVGSESDFVSVAETPRTTLAKHPWSVGGGGAAELKEELEADRSSLASITKNLGFSCITGEDEAFVMPSSAFGRLAVERRIFVLGDELRDWSIQPSTAIAFPYEGAGIKAVTLQAGSDFFHHFWPLRTNLRNRQMFGKTPEQSGFNWWELSFVSRDRLAAPYIITFSEVATHNHFVLDRGGKVFKQTAPVIKLPAGSSEDEHLGLLGLLNSSTGCFWLKQVCHNKGGGGINEGHRGDKWEFFFALNSTKVADFPLSNSQPVDLSSRLDAHARQLSALQPAAVVSIKLLPTRARLDAARDQASCLRRLMIAGQEELDWRCYRLYDLLPRIVAVDDVEHSGQVEVNLGERAFEIVLARRIEAGTESNAWFERHGSTPVTEIPAHWPEPYRRVAQRRIELIENDKCIGLIERPEFKRRWNSPKWENLEQSALRDWLLGRLEAPALWSASADQPPQLTSAHRLADAVQRDADLMQVAALYAGRPDFQLPQLVSELVTAESVPFLPVLRYADSGLRKRDQWEATWALQRHEDRIDAEVEAESPGWREELQAQTAKRFGSTTSPDSVAWVEDQLAKEIAQQKVERKENEVGKIPVPPKYQSKDFLKTDVWRLRGGLDVPKERWVSYPGCERGADGSLPIAWAGWDHLQQAMALASYFIDMKEREGWSPERLQPLLAGLLELVPWLKQWHNEMNPEFGARMGDYYESFVNDEARALQFTLDDLRAWKPPVTATKRGRKKAA